MGKINRKNLVSLIKVGIVGLGLLFGIFTLFFAVPLSLVKNEKILDIYIPSVILVILLSVLVILYYSCIAYKNNKPKYIDGKYVWKDGRVYEGEWDKKHGANGKGKLTWSDGSYYEGEFKNGYVFGKGKKVVSNGTIFEGTWVNGFLDGKGKILGEDGGVYEGEFKKGKPDGMGIIKMINGYYYEGEFRDGKKTGEFKKQILTSGGVIEGKFRDNGNDGFDGVGKISTSNGFVFEGTFKNGKLNGEGKMTTPEGKFLIGTFENGEFKKGKQILKNGEYSEGNWINGHLIGMARYYFKDGSYYEGECGDMGWQGIGIYSAKNGDKYSTEFPYKIINVFHNWVSEKIREINEKLNYIPKTEKEKVEEKNTYLKILERGTSLQKEIAGLYLEEYEKDEILLDSMKRDNSIGNVLKFHKGLFKIHEVVCENFRKLTKKYHIKNEEKSSYYSYGQYFNKLNGMYAKERDVNVLYIKIDEFLHPKNILSFVINREKKEKEWVVLIDDFSDKYNEYIQGCLDWREYDKKFWKHKFKPGKKGK